MFTEYFKIIRQALLEKRAKGQENYYEAHHIIPKSFNKKSSIVLLTAQEHYNCHKILAKEFTNHLIYGQKMLWAFHRLVYSKGVKLSAEDYAEARECLVALWKRKKTKEHKKNISKAQKGNINNRSRVYKGMKSTITKEGRKKLSEIAIKRQTGKFGLNATASKGEVIYESKDGTKISAGSALQLSYLLKLSPATVCYRLKKQEVKFIKGYKIYYKNLNC